MLRLPFALRLLPHAVNGRPLAMAGLHVAEDRGTRARELVRKAGEGVARSTRLLERDLLSFGDVLTNGAGGGMPGLVQSRGELLAFRRLLAGVLVRWEEPHKGLPLLMCQSHTMLEGIQDPLLRSRRVDPLGLVDR